LGYEYIAYARVYALRQHVILFMHSNPPIIYIYIYIIKTTMLKTEWIRISFVMAFQVGVTVWQYCIPKYPQKYHQKYSQQGVQKKYLNIYLDIYILFQIDRVI
jgi:hypothetical protein